MDILTYINRMNQIYGNGPAPAPRYNTQQYLQGGRVGYQGGQLVDHGPGRQGFMEGKLITMGANKDKWGVPSWDHKAKKNKWRYFDSKPEVDAFIKSLPGTGQKTGTVRYDYYDTEGNKLERTVKDKPKQVSRKNLDTGKWEKIVARRNEEGKKIQEWKVQKPNETKSQFFNRIKKESVVAKEKATIDLVKGRKEALTYTRDWTTNWLDDNLGRYKVREANKMINNLSEDWKVHAKTLENQSWFKSAQSYLNKDFPAVGRPSAHTKEAIKKAWSYDGIKPLSTTLDKALLKIFYKNKINTTLGLKDGLNQYLDFMNQDKKGWRTAKTQTSFKNISRVEDVVYLLSKDSGLYGTSKYQLFNNLDDDIKEKYRKFIIKVNNGLQWKQNAKTIERALGKNTIKELVGDTSIVQSMAKERKVLQDIFGVSTLDGTGLGYSIEHSQGLSNAAKTGNKEFMKQALTDLVGTTKDINRTLGRGGFEVQRIALSNAIRRGENVGDNLTSLNKLAKIAYTDLGLDGNMYSIKNGQLVSENVSRSGSTMYDRFGQWAKQIHKTKIGRAEVERLHGSLENLLKKLGCGKATGGRVGFAEGSGCLEKGKKKMNEHLIKGTGTTVERGMIAKIIQGGSNLMKGLSFQELIKLRNLIGPAALAFEAGIGAGVITYDTLVKGTPIKQALGNNWLTSWAMPKSGTEYMHEDMNLSSPGAKTWGKGLDLQSEHDRLTKQLALLEGDPSAHQGLLDPKTEIPKVKKRMNEIVTEFNKVTRDGAAMQEGTGAHEEYMKAVTEYQAKMMTRDKIADDVGLKPQKSYSRFGPRGMGIKDEAAKIKINQKRFSLPESKLNLLTRDQVMDIAKEQNINVTPQQADEFIVEDKWRQLFEQPGIRGAQDWRGATGGRVSFKFGKRGIDAGKRGFLKLLAALGIGTATVGTGLIKLGGKAVGKKVIAKSGVDIATSTPGMPSWFPALVNKIIKEGDDVTAKLATTDRQVVHTKKIDTGSASPDDVTVYRDLDTGDIRVEVDSVSNMGEAPIQLDYKAPSVIDSGKSAGKKTKPEFSAVESEPRVTNWEGDIEMDGENIVGSVDDLFSDTTKLKNYAKGEKPTMKDIVTRKRKTDKIEKIHKNPSEQLEYVEKKEGMTMDDFIDEAARVGEFEARSGTKGMNLPDKKIKKASGGLASYDNYLPGIDELD